jgi:hypothetical protein
VRTALLGAVLLLSGAGCSLGLAQLGRHRALLQHGSHVEIVAALGPPAKVCKEAGLPFGEKPDPCRRSGCSIEIYRVFGKYPDDELSDQWGSVDAQTLFVGEVVQTPVELVRTTYKSVTHGLLKVVYCGDMDAPGSVRTGTYTTTDVDALATGVCAKECSPQPSAAGIGAQSTRLP